MKEKGFTLIELLAVIVILAIIALIAVPIILNIIEDSKNSSNKRSIELYAKAIENAIGQYQLKNSQDKDITLEKIDPYIEYKGNKVECETTEINKDGTIYLAGCKINGIEVEYTYGKEQEEVTNQICTLVEGTSKTIGAKYTCTLDDVRTFFVLENNESSNDITLLMDRNYTDAEVPVTTAWCQDSYSFCEYDSLKPYIENIQAKFGKSVTVGIPSKEQMAAIGCTKSDGSCPAWSYNYLEQRSDSSSLAAGYWTSTEVIYANEPLYAYSVGYSGGCNDLDSVDWEFDNGIRPIINVQKNLLN